jgi:hypothetical protein
LIDDVHTLCSRNTPPAVQSDEDGRGWSAGAGPESVRDRPLYVHRIDRI